MSPPGGQPVTAISTPKALAFYLPQYHPIPENDEWWGKGFTEWMNVTRARPLYPGHYQPHVPGELGYYDLRVPEVREAQAELARGHGITGFVYYHYWFKGRRLLERPFDEVLASGSPDLPFALCWANEEWTRNWDGQSGQLLIPQEHSDDDDVAHLRWLACAFADDRYIKIDGRPLMLVYRPMMLPDSKRTTDLWRDEAERLGFPGLYLAWVEAWGRPPGGPEAFGFDATVGFMPPRTERLFTPLESTRGHRFMDYESAFEAQLAENAPGWKHFPSVMVGWDNTARRPRGATIFEGATPQAYRRWLEETVSMVGTVRDEENYLFLLAWNEWAEGNHLEPDQRFGRGFLEATRSVLVGPVSPTSESADVAAAGADDRAGTPSGRTPAYEGVAVNAVELIGELGIDPHRGVVDLSPNAGMVDAALTRRGITRHAVGVPVETREAIRTKGCEAEVFGTATLPFDQLDDVGALVLLDVVEHLAEPQLLLSALSQWSLENGEPVLVASAPNVAHFDLGLGLLCGQLRPGDAGLLDGSHLRFFTETTLERLYERCGWRVIGRNDFYAVESGHYDPELHDSLPEELVGALHVLSQTYNPAWATQHFVWALSPVKATDPPTSFAGTVGHPDEPVVRDLPDAHEHPVYDYMASLGLVASEVNRRAVSLRRMPPPRWRRAMLRIVTATPPTEKAFDALRRLFR